MTIFNLGGGGGGSAAYYIRVRVSASAGTPDLSGIQVTATSSGRPTVTGTTDSTGECYLSVKQGATYTVALSKQFYTFSPASQQATTSEPVTDLTATCYVQPSITVNVGGVDISGRTVTLTPASGSAVSQVTGGSGSVTFQGLAITTYTITVDYPAGQGVSPASDTQVTAAGGSYTKSFTILSKPTLEVTVSSATGNVSGRTITATPTSGGNAVTAQTNGSGVATLTLMAGTQYTVACDAPSGYFSVTSQQTTLAAGADSDMSFTLQRKPIVNVTVTDASGGGNEVGRTVQMSGPSDTQTATTVTGGTCGFTANNTGAYSFTVTNLPDGASVSAASQTLAADGTYSVSMEISFGWTHTLTFNASTFQSDPTAAFGYADDAAGFTKVSNSSTSLAKVTQEGSWGFDPDTGIDCEGLFYCTFQNGSNGQFPHQLLDPYNLAQYIALWDDDAKEWDYAETGASAIASENTMINIPTIYTSAPSGNMRLSSKSDGGSAKAHTIDSHIYQYLALSVYKPVNSGGVLKSLSGQTATTNQTRATFRTQAQANTIRNGHAMLWNWWMYRLDCKLKYMRAGSTDLQRRIGQGGHSYSTRHTGDTNALGPFAGNISGMADHVKDLDEDPWGCLYYFVDDVYISNTNLYAGQSSNPSDDTSGKVAQAVFGYSSGFPNQIQTDDDKWGMGMNGSGSNSTGLCDYQNLTSTTSPVPDVCGYSDYVSNGRAGPACLGRSALSDSFSSYGTRLAFVYDL